MLQEGLLSTLKKLWLNKHSINEWLQRVDENEGIKPTKSREQFRLSLVLEGQNTGRLEHR